MKTIVFKYGAIAGLITITSMTIGLVASGGEGVLATEAFGYLIMLIALSMIFIGIKKYRDEDLGGVIRFTKALLVGLAISAVSGLFYVIGWESYLLISDYAFIEDYTAGVIEARKAAGISDADLEKLIAEMNEMKEGYRNPFFRIPITFLEIFPVGIVVSLVSAALLRNPKVLPAARD